MGLREPNLTPNYSYNWECYYHSYKANNWQLGIFVVIAIIRSSKDA
jgi:hypothetical protein